MRHKPVLLEEVLRVLDLKPGELAVDGTLGSAGHALEMAKAVGPGGYLIGLDQDPQSIERSRSVLKDFPQVRLYIENFLNLDRVLANLKISLVDAVLLDVGFSSDQLGDASRGFSFENEGPLDMRMNPDAEVTAGQLINELSQEELETIFRVYGEEPRARKIAAGIIRERSGQRLETTFDLAQVVNRALSGSRKAGPEKPGWARRHPATRVFQALRIAVNDELNILRETLPSTWKCIRAGGRLAVISFHSLEDRIVKQTFRSWAETGETRPLTKKPLTASEEEIKINPRARSAKLRAVEKMR